MLGPLAWLPVCGRSVRSERAGRLLQGPAVPRGRIPSRSSTRVGLEGRQHPVLVLPAAPSTLEVRGARAPQADIARAPEVQLGTIPQCGFQLLYGLSV